MKPITKLTLCIALGALALGAFAQRGGGMRGGGMFFNKYMLLNQKDVQTDLKLSDDQVSKLATLRQKAQEDMRTARENAQASGDGSTMRDAMKKINDEYNPQFDAVLTGDQRGRLEQLALQARGNNALADPDVQSKLGFTEDQKAKVKTLMQQQQDANSALFEKVQSQEMTREDAFAASQKNNDILKDELGKILTSDQDAKFKEMQGMPFAGKFEMPGFGRRRGGGGGGA